VVKKKYEMVCIAAALLIVSMSIPVQATITNEGVEKLIDIDDDYDPSYNPEGNKIVFSVYNTADANQGSIWILDLQTLESSQINIPNSRYIYTKWSPFSDKIAYYKDSNTDGRNLYIINLDGSNQICLTCDQDLSPYYPNAPEFNSDGSKIAYFSYFTSYSQKIGNIWVMDADGGNKMQLPSDNEYNVLPSWSPDNTKITFSSGVWPNAHIWIMDSDGSNRIQLTDGSGMETYPTWSPDGRFIAYQKEDTALQDPWNIWVMKADGSEQTQLTNWAVDGIDGASPEWHPDGNKLVFVSNGMNTVPHNIDWDIYEMTLGGINQPPIANAGISYVSMESTSITFDASASYDLDGDLLQYRWDFDNDGTWDTDWSNNPFASNTWTDEWIGTAKVEVSDGDYTDTNTNTAIVTVNNVAPSIISIDNIPVDPVPVGTTILPTATFTDPGTLDIHTAVWDWDGLEETSVGNVDQNQDSVTGSHMYNTPGIYTIQLTVTDDEGGSDTAVATHYLVVYDSDGGFVTGGGWIDSFDGAYVPQPTLTGKANFGFVSKYKKGATTPTGQTEFQFKVADLNFHSNNYEWLVIAGHKAIYKGTGTINGEGNFGFLLSAVDEALTPSTEVDLFRIKIWDKENNDAVIYDNHMGENDDADPTTGISGGSIVIHK